MNSLRIKNSIFNNVLIAITDAEQEKGLMFKSWPPPIMAFPYNKAEKRKFWMKNTSSPLDVIFCKNNKIISIFKGEPFSMKNFGPDETSDLVIEFPYGMAKNLDIKAGDEVKLQYSIKTIAKKYEFLLKKGRI